MDYILDVQDIHTFIGQYHPAGRQVRAKEYYSIIGT
jgi:hypothetical protein